MEGTKRTIPAPLWVTIVALGVITLLTLLSLLQSNLLARFAAAVCNLALMVGLVLGHKWAYVLTIVVSVLGVAVGFGKGFSSGLVMLLGNGLVVVPVLLSTRFFSRLRTRDKAVVLLSRLRLTGQAKSQEYNESPGSNHG